MLIKILGIIAFFLLIFLSAYRQHVKAVEKGAGFDEGWDDLEEDVIE